MEKPSFKLVGSPCGHHGQYTFYKALRLTGPSERILAIGDFFFVRIWQDSELVSIGELQLLWTDRVSDQTLVSLRLYFLPENTPDGRSLHGEDEVLAINDKVVVRADDLLSWMCSGHNWTYGLRAVWRGACAPPHGDARHTTPLHTARLDFSDVDKEKSAIAVDAESPGVVVFSYPRYCRYRALLSRLEGMQAAWLRDSLVGALGGYAAPTKNTRILYCKDTFEYPELEGHEFVCNHLAPKLKGRPRGRRRRPPRSRTHSPESRSSDDERAPPPETHRPTPRRLSLRNGLEKRSSDSEDREINVTEEDKAFLRMLRHFHRDRGLSFTQALSLKHLSLRALYALVSSRGGYEAVCRLRLWRGLFHADHSTTRAVYERFLLPFENHERRNGVKPNGVTDTDTITVCDSPPHAHIDNETGEVKEDMNITSKPAEELNREFLDSLPKEEKPLKITVKPAEKLIDTEKRESGFEKRESGYEKRESGYEKRENAFEKKDIEKREFDKEERKEGFFSELANKLNLGNSDTTFLQELARQNSGPHPAPPAPHLPSPAHNEQTGSRPAGRSSLRAVRVKPARAHTAPNTAPNTPPVPPLRPDSASSSPPSLPPATAPVTNFGIHHPPPHHSTSDDEIVEVPYKPKTPEIIDLDEYPESPQAVKKKKLDILKERGLEVTPLPAPGWPTSVIATPLIAPSPILLPAVQHQIMTNAQLFQMYNIIPQNYNRMQPPKVIQATPLYGTTSPEKTVYGNPKDPFMPPPHVLHGAPIKPTKSVLQPPTPAQDILDLTCKLSTKPAVEIVRVSSTPSPSKNSAQNLTKNYSIVDGKAVVGSNLEITLVNKTQPTPQLSPLKKQVPQKRSSNGKFTKTPTPPKDYPKPYKKNPITVPNYQVSREDSPTSSTSSQNSQKNVATTVDPKGPVTSYMDPVKGHVSSYLDPSKAPISPYLDPSKGAASYHDPSKVPVSSYLDPSKGPVASFLDPSKGPVSSFIDPYMALYNLAGQMDPRQLAAYREIMANPFRYSGLLNMGVGNPTTKN